MDNNQHRLKLRLKFKRVNAKIDEIVDWNFGYSPVGNVEFDKALEEFRDILNTAKELYPDLYEEFTDIMVKQ